MIQFSVASLNKMKPNKSGFLAWIRAASLKLLKVEVDHTSTQTGFQTIMSDHFLYSWIILLTVTVILIEVHGSGIESGISTPGFFFSEVLSGVAHLVLYSTNSEVCCVFATMLTFLDGKRSIVEHLLTRSSSQSQLTDQKSLLFSRKSHN